MDRQGLDWSVAEEHLGRHAIEYLALLGRPGINVMYVLTHQLAPICRRFSDGERTVELYDEIMEISL